MPTRQVVNQFIALVESGAHVEAIEQFYAPDASMQENSHPPRSGLANLVAHERVALAAVREMRTLPAQSVLVDGDLVVIQWIFEYVTADGRTFRMEELAHQRWRGDKIVQERFFYDPAQRKTPVAD